MFLLLSQIFTDNEIARKFREKQIICQMSIYTDLRGSATQYAGGNLFIWFYRLEPARCCKHCSIWRNSEWRASSRAGRGSGATAAAARTPAHAACMRTPHTHNRRRRRALRCVRDASRPRSHVGQGAAAARDLNLERSNVALPRLIANRTS